MKLFSDLNIVDPKGILVGYLKSVYRRYDSKPVDKNNTLSLEDIIVSRSLVSRLSDVQANAILALGPLLSQCLVTIPAEIDLLDVANGANIPGSDGISRLVTAMCNLPGVKLAKTMKILHRKRPALLPIFDSVVEGQYWPALKASMRRSSWGDYTLSLMRAFHRDMLGVENDLRALCHYTVDAATPLSHCRILDLLIWATLTGQADYYRRLP